MSKGKKPQYFTAVKHAEKAEKTEKAEKKTPAKKKSTDPAALRGKKKA